MGKVILYLATSLDGFIADKDGGYAFLENYSDMGSYDYPGFTRRIGTIIMGRKSYDLVRKNNPNQWEFDGFETYVYTRSTLPNEENIYFTSENPYDLVKYIKRHSNKDIWLFGGAEIIDLFQKERVIDEYWIYYVAEVLGEGIPLFKSPILNDLQIISTKQFDNLVEIKLAPKNVRIE